MLSNSKYAKKWEATLERLQCSDRRPVKIDEGSNLGILETMETLATLVGFHKPMFTDDQRRLAIAVLALFRRRLADISMRDHVLLLWTLLGDRYLRAHDGICHYYDNSLGTWSPFNGLLPDYISGEIKSMLLHVEGLLRDFAGEVKREELGVLNAIDVCAL